MKVLTLLLDLPDLLHRLLQDGTFVGLEVEVVDVIYVGEDQLCQLLNVFILLFPVAFLKASLGAGSQTEQQKNNNTVIVRKNPTSSSKREFYLCAVTGSPL